MVVVEVGSIHHRTEICHFLNWLGLGAEENLLLVHRSLLWSVSRDIHVALFGWRLVAALVIVSALNKI